MIQRIQTVYLVFIAALTALVISFPIMEIISGEGVFYKVTVLGAYVDESLEYSVWTLLALCISTILIALTTVLLFKNRMLQIRLCVFNILLIIGFYAMLEVYYYLLKERFSAEVIQLKWTVVLPAINIILTYLSIRAIGRDEALVMATRRLR